MLGVFKHEKSFLNIHLLDKKSTSSTGKSFNILVIGACFVENPEDHTTVFFSKKLEVLLAQKLGVKVNVFVRSTPGLTSLSAAREIQGWLSENDYKFVVINLGSGDLLNGGIYKESILNSIKSFFSESNFFIKINSTLNELNRKEIKKIISNIDKKRIQELEQSLKESNQFNDKMELVRLYHENFGTNINEKVVHILEKEIEIELKTVDQYKELLFSLKLFGLNNLIKKELDFIEKTKRVSRNEQELLFRILKEDKYEMDEFVYSSAVLNYMNDKKMFPALGHNLQYIVEKIIQRRSVPVLLQYPKRKASLISNLLNPSSDVLIVDNYKSFIDLEMKYGYEKVYANKDYGDSGALTNFGHDEIAKNIFMTISNAYPSMFNDKLH
jgi:hypothetical protein